MRPLRPPLDAPLSPPSLRGGLRCGSARVLKKGLYSGNPPVSLIVCPLPLAPRAAGNKIGDIGAAALATALKKNRTLQSLQLDGMPPPAMS